MNLFTNRPMTISRPLLRLPVRLAALTALTAFALHAQEDEAPNPIERAVEAREAADANTRLLDPVLEAAEPETTDRAPESTEPEPADEPPPSSTTPAAPANPEQTLETFDLDYTDTPIRTILRNVGEAADLNVVIPDSLLGSISIQLKGVTWQQVFDIALENTGFVWERDESGIIRIQRVGADKAIEIGENGLVTVNFRAVAIHSAVQALAEAVGLNIIVPADLEGTTSASLANVTWQRVLTGILEENDYQWFEDEGIIGIRKVDSRVVLDPQTDTLNINVTDTTFQEVVTLIGQTQTPVVNVVSPPEIENLPISLEVQGVSFQQALDLAILKLPRISLGEGEADSPRFQTYSTYQQGPNLVQIVDSQFMANLRNEPPVVRIFELRYASAGDLLMRLMPTPADTSESLNQPIPSFRQASEAIRPVVDGVQSVAADHANNLLLVTARPAALQEVASLLERLDQPLKQILIESKFVEITGQDQKNLGIDWATLRGFQVSAGPFTRNWSRNRSQQDNSTTTTTRSDTRSDTFNRSNSFDSNSIDNSDGSSSSSLSNTSNITDNNGVVSTENVSDSANASASSAEFDSTANRAFNQSRDINRTISSTDSFTNTLQNVASTARADSAIFTTDQFALILRALEEESDAKLVTNPNVVAINGKQAQVELADYFFKPGPVETSDGVTTRGEPVPLEPRPGTTLSVTPTVVGGQLIALKVIPQVNSVVGNQTIDGNEIPTVRRRATDSEVLLRSGSTLAIGGLITDENVSSTNKVPVLGDIPVLGRLFSSETTNVQTTNQIIFITASLLNPQSNTYMDVIGIDRFNAMGLTDREVQGVGARKLSPEEMALQQAVRQARNDEAYEEMLRTLRARRQVEEAELADGDEPEGDEAEEIEDGGGGTQSRTNDRPYRFGPIGRR